MQMKSPPPISIPWWISPWLHYKLSLQIIICQIMVYESQVHGPRDINNYYNRGYQRVIGTSHHLFTTFSSVFRYSQGCRANIILGHTSHYWSLSMVMVYKVDFYEILHPSRKRTPKTSSVHIEYWVCVSYGQKGIKFLSDFNTKLLSSFFALCASFVNDWFMHSCLQCLCLLIHPSNKNFPFLFQ